MISSYELTCIYVLLLLSSLSAKLVVKNPNVNAHKYYLRKELYIDSLVDISVHTCFPLGKYSTLNQ